MRILNVSEPPTSYTAEGKLTGFVTEVVEKIEQDMGIKTPIETVPASRALAYLEHAPNVMAFTFAKTPEREALGLAFVGPLTTRDQIVWMRKGKGYKIASANDIKQQHLLLGSPIGDWRTKYFLEQGVKVDPSDAHEFDLEHLNRGWIDVCALSDLEMPYVAQARKIDAANFEAAFVFAPAVKAYLVFSKNTPADTIRRWEAALQNLGKTGFLNDTAKKWSAPNYPLGYDESKGFFLDQNGKGRIAP
ncbi:MAG: ABC transporter substrate-binding protein [Burkholderiaceae bacterium]|nr:ABC transporter substrate-binding protein [Burkholderiaceae bacterium]